MSKQRIQSIEYIRGIAMLGVIGIHTGSFSLSNPCANIHLFALLEIASRFSVPIFFFISAFGMFRSQNINEPLDYRSFMHRRARTVLLPYLAWSFLYMVHYTITYGDFSIWHWPLIAKYLFFGLASYQLYFLVILLWFYAMMPLWRAMVRFIIRQPLLWLSILFILQIAFNYYSSYIMKPNTSSHLANLLIEHRLDYWVIHYLFVFMLGAICALKFDSVKAIIARHYYAFMAMFFTTLGGMLAAYYYLLYHLHYTPESAANTIHQLSPIGVLYTFAACMFLTGLLSRPLPRPIDLLLGKLSKHSYVIYLVHPFVMFYLGLFLAWHNLLMTGLNTIIFYITTAAGSLFIAAAVQAAAIHYPIVGAVLSGKAPKK